MTHRTRKLRVLWIDDITDEPEGPLTVALNVRRDLDEVAEFMLEPGGGRADIVVCDAWMQRSGHPEDLDWGSRDVAGYGPLLALPFLQSNQISAFVPVSGAWNYLQDNGFVLAALALIRTRTLGTVQTFDDAREWLAKRLASGNHPRENIMEGVGDYRRRLIELAVKGEDVAVAGLKEAITLVKGWRKGELLREPHGVPAHIEVISRQGCDRIEVESLFGDILELSALTEGRRDALLAALQEMYDSGVGLQFDREESLYSRAAALLTDAMPGDSGVERYGILKRAQKEVGKTEEAYWLVRFALLFAFLRAHYFVSVCDVEFDDAEILAVDKDPKPYDKRDWTYHFTGVDPTRPSVVNVIKRYLGQEIEGILHIGPGPARRAFADRFQSESAEDVLEAYSCLFDEKEAGNLTAMEKYLCLRFLDDDGGKFFPSTLSPDHRTLWKPYDLPGQPPYPAWLNW